MSIDNIKAFLKGWLRHLVLFLLLLNLFDSIDYLVRIQIQGAIYRNPDGSAVSLGQRLIAHNFGRPDTLYVIAFTFLIEMSSNKSWTPRS